MNPNPDSTPPPARRWTLVSLVAILPLLAVSCATPRPRVSREFPAVKPELILAPDSPGAPEAKPRTVPRTQPGLAAVVTQPEVAAYSVGRYVDPADPSMLHEAHVVYRREAQSGWRLVAPDDGSLTVGPVLTGRGAADPLRLQELGAQIETLRRETRENRVAIETLLKAVEMLATRQVPTGAALESEAARQSRAKGVPAAEKAASCGGAR